MEALYWTDMHKIFISKDIKTLREDYLGKIRVFATSMLEGTFLPYYELGAKRILAIEYLLFPETNPQLIDHLKHEKDSLGWVYDELDFSRSIDEERDKNLDIDISPLDQVRNILTNLENSESLDILSALNKKYKGLTDEEKITLTASSDSNKKVILEANEKFSAPNNWIDWLIAIRDEGFVDPLRVATIGSEEWNTNGFLENESMVKSLRDELSRSFNSEISEERISQALPYLVSWLKRDDHFPRPSLKSLYRDILVLFSLGSVRHKQTFESGQIIISSLLQVGLNQNEYGELLDSIEGIMGDGFGTKMIFWIFEILEEILSNISPDITLRERFLERILAKLVPLIGRMTPLQLLNIKLLAQELDWNVKELDAALESKNSDNIFSELNKMSIGIYSLIESASKKAKELLQSYAPSVKIECNSDDAGNPRLRSMAKNSDLVVIVWLAATHAATNVITMSRVDAPIVYAQGKGCSSIIRCIEEYLKETKK